MKANSIRNVAKNFIRAVSALIVVGPNLNRTNERSPKWSMRFPDDLNSIPRKSLAISGLDYIAANSLEAPSGCQNRISGHPCSFDQTELAKAFEVKFHPAMGFSRKDSGGYVNIDTISKLVLMDDGKQMAVPA